MSGGGGGIGQVLPLALAVGATVASGGALAPEALGATLSGGLLEGTGASLLGGAALGAGTSGLGAALTGGNVGQSALMGGLGGAATAGIMGGLGGATPPTNPTVAEADIATNPTMYSPGQAPQPIVGGTGADALEPTSDFSPTENKLYSPGEKTIDIQGGPGPDALNPANTTGPTPGATPTPGSPNYLKYAKYGALGLGGLGLINALGQQNTITPQASPGVPAGLQFNFDPSRYNPSVAPNYNGVPGLGGTAPAQRLMGYGYADGGPVGTVEEMSRMNATGSNQMFPQANLSGLTGTNTFQNATNTPMGSNVVEPTDAITDPYTGAMKFAMGGIANASPTSPTQDTQQNTSLNLPLVREYMAAAKTSTGLKQLQIAAQKGDYNAEFALNNLQNNPVQDINAPSQMQAPVQAAAGGIMGYAKGGTPTPSLGSYSDGGQMLKGPGDGMSDSIPARIGKHQPARLADGEFVVPADVVSHLGNGSTDAGAKHLYAMMDKVRQARTGRKAQGKKINPEKYMPA